ncbi:hypothetical protein BDV97DRAFT_355511 [Delphinella strobiligena]|nr:hypothetical protein BDV97DRAFT_355511 [Delphinella strobiligena]
MADHPPRPPTPQAMVHRLPDISDVSSMESTKPSKFIVLIVATTAVAGKVQIAKSVSNALTCPLFHGDSLHETASRAASVGPPMRADGHEQAPSSGANETRYQRMWLSKMTRTGLLFPDESRPANSEFSGFGGASSTSTSRRGSASSVASDVSSIDAAGSTSSIASSGMSYGAQQYINKPPVITQSDDESAHKASPVLMVVTHPQLESWHKDCIRKAIGDYSIGVIFVPLDEDEELPVLTPLDPRTMAGFGSLSTFGIARRAVCPSWDEELVLIVNIEANVEDLTQEIIDGVRDIVNA